MRCVRLPSSAISKASSGWIEHQDPPSGFRFARNVAEENQTVRTCCDAFSELAALPQKFEFHIVREHAIRGDQWLCE